MKYLAAQLLVQKQVFSSVKCLIECLERVLGRKTQTHNEMSRGVVVSSLKIVFQADCQRIVKKDFRQQKSE